LDPPAEEVDTVPAARGGRAGRGNDFPEPTPDKAFAIGNGIFRLASTIEEEEEEEDG
jgi:hypothetical protein